MVRLAIHYAVPEATNLDQAPAPSAGGTTGAMVPYHERLSEVMLPHLAQRRVSVARQPTGITTS